MLRWLAGQLCMTHSVSLQHCHLKALGWGVCGLVVVSEEMGVNFCLSEIPPSPCPRKRTSKSPSLKWSGQVPTDQAQEDWGGPGRCREGGKHCWVIGEEQRTGKSVNCTLKAFTNLSKWLNLTFPSFRFPSCTLGTVLILPSSLSCCKNT